MGEVALVVSLGRNVMKTHRVRVRFFRFSDGKRFAIIRFGKVQIDVDVTSCDVPPAKIDVLVLGRGEKPPKHTNALAVLQKP